MGIPDLPEKDLLGVVSCKTTKSHNKVLHFRYEREGTVFFVHKKGSEYIFSMKPDRTAKQVVIKRNTYPNFLYIPVKQIISEEGDVSIYRKGKDYIVKPASEKEIQLKKKKTNTKYTLAQRTNINGIILPKADRSRLYATGTLKMHIVSGKGKLYAEAAPCAPEEKIPDLKQAASPYGGWEYLGQAEEYTYKRSVPKAPSTILPLPISFIRKSEMAVGETFHTYFRQDGTFVIEPKPLVCEACGKKIDRYKDAGHETTVCRSCSRTMPVVRIAKNNGANYEELIREVRALKKELNTILGGFTNENR